MPFAFPRSRRFSARFLLFVVLALSAIALGTLIPQSASMQSVRDKTGRGDKFLGGSVDDGTVDPTFNPSIEDGKGQGTISAILPDGKILVGGGFAFTNGVERGSLARLNADGTIDTTFNPNGVGPNSRVFDIALLPGGQFLIGGSFTTYNGTPTGSLARINPDGTLDSTFNVGGAGVVGTVQTVSLQADGKILISGGGMSSYNGVARFSVIRVNADGTLDTNFTSPFTTSQFVEAVAQQADGKLIIAGSFNIGSPTYRSVARLNSNGSLDTTFNQGGAGMDASGAAYGLFIQSDGKILITGAFSTYNGTARTGVMRLNATGTLDTGFTPPSSGPYGGEYFDVQPDGKILVAGHFILGGLEPPILRLNTDGTLDNSFQLHTADALGYAVKIQPDGKIVLSGYFNFIDGNTRRNIIRLNPDGTVDGSFNTAFIAFGSTSPIAEQPDGKILVGGNFERANGAARSNIARFLANGTFDPTFTPGAMVTDYNGSNIVRAIVVQPDGKILIAGSFSSYQGALRHSIARLNPNGTLDTTFVPSELNAIGNTVFDTALVNDMALLPNGKILIGGFFSTFTYFKGIIQLNSDGSTDTAAFPDTRQPNSTVSKLRVQPDGKVLMGGNFTNYCTPTCTSRVRIVRANADGTLDTGFNPGTGANSTVSNIVVLPDGKILISGAFNQINGTSRSRIARLNSDGSLDSGFNPGTGTNGGSSITGLSVRADGKIIIGGNFSSYNGNNINRLARINGGGSFDSSFVSGFNTDNRFSVSRTLIQQDGKLLVSGTFQAYGGAPHLSLVRIGTTNYTISGQVISNGAPLGGVTMTLTGSSTASAATDSNGNYSFTVAAAGSYTVTPTLSGNTFTPADQTFNSIAANQTANFAADAVTYSVSGNVKANGVDLPGATVSLSNGSTVTTTTTDGSGNYSFVPVNGGFNYTVSVIKAGYLFDPSNQSINNLSSSQTVNFQNGVSLCVAPPGDQVAWYRGQGNGDDSSGLGNDAQLTSVDFVAGKVGQAFSFDNIADRVTVNDSASLTPQSAMSIDLWVKPAQVTQQVMFVSKYDGSNAQGRSYFLGTDSTGTKVQFAVYQTPGDASSLVRSIETVNSVLTANVFTHITAVFDGVTQTQKIYINGVDVAANVTGSDNVTSIADSVTPLRIGSYVNAAGNPDRFFTGLIDEVQIYGHAMPVGEVLSVNTADIAGLCTANIAPTPTGSNVSSNPTPNINLNFQNVGSGGTTVATPLNTSQLPALPQGFTLSSGGPTYEIHTSATYSGPLTITFQVPNIGSAQVCAALRILHYENGVWTSDNNGTPVYDPQTQICTVTQTVNSLSPFAVAQSNPLAAGVEISGRVTVPDVRSVVGAKLTLTGPDGASRTITTEKGGGFRFSDVAAGRTYILRVNARGYQFDPDTMVISVSDSVTGLTFRGSAR